MIILAIILGVLASLGADPGAVTVEPMPWITGGGLGTLAVVVYFKLGNIEKAVDDLHDDVRIMNGWPPRDGQRRRRGDRGRDSNPPPTKGSDSSDSAP